ncbi:MAG: hypothetical protein OEX12_14335, partial [Gammaproteobacteria bacterium]|nr:hypothetical protein [Gammaproteobacteria bacterium]
RSYNLVAIEAVLSKAQALRSQLHDGSLEPIILLLTHPFWGADLEYIAPIAGLRALFVQYPNSDVLRASTVFDVVLFRLFDGRKHQSRCPHVGHRPLISYGSFLDCRNAFSFLRAMR